MCNSDPRYKNWGKMSKSTTIPIFWPVLSYNSDNSDQDTKAVLYEKRWCYEDKHSKKGCSSKPLEKKHELKDRNPVPSFMAGTVVKSHHEHHNATILCNSNTLKGPDFLSLHEGIFCDMDKKELWPLCSKDVPHGCFDADTNKMRPRPHGRRT